MVANSKSGITIPFGSLRERAGGFKCCTDHFLTFYDSLRSKLITMPSFSAEEA